jgi:hypothetical protein
VIFLNIAREAKQSYVYLEEEIGPGSQRRFSTLAKIIRAVINVYQAYHLNLTAKLAKPPETGIKKGAPESGTPFG